MAEMTREQRIGNILELARGLDPQEKRRIAMRLRFEAVLDTKRQKDKEREAWVINGFYSESPTVTSFSDSPSQELLSA